MQLPVSQFLKGATGPQYLANMETYVILRDEDQSPAAGQSSEMEDIMRHDSYMKFFVVLLMQLGMLHSREAFGAAGISIAKASAHCKRLIPVCEDLYTHIHGEQPPLEVTACPDHTYLLNHQVSDLLQEIFDDNEERINNHFSVGTSSDIDRAINAALDYAARINIMLKPLIIECRKYEQILSQ